MIERLKWKYVVLALSLLCGLIRVLFVTTQEQLPVMWDARLYSSSALGTLHYLTEGGDFGHPDNLSPVDSVETKTAFIEAMNDYIDGEQIEWLYYPVPNMATAQEYIFIAGPVYPVCLAAVLAISPGADFTVVRILNGLIEAFCLVLMMLISNLLFNRRVAVIAGLIYCFYLPFIILSGMVSPDSITILMTLLVVYLLVDWSRGGRKWNIYLAGIILGLLALNRSTATLLIVPFALGIMYDYRTNIKLMLSSLARLIIPFVIAIAPWLIVASSYYGQMTLRDPSYAEANLRSSSIIETEGYDLDYVDDDFWTKSVWDNINANKTGYIGLLAKKFVRLWAQPFNDFGQYFILNNFLSILIHLVIILSGLFGILLFLVKKESGYVYLFLIPAYYTLLHIIFHALARYNLNAMPMMIIGSSVVLYYLYNYIRQIVAQNIKNLTIPLIIIVGALVLLFPPTSGLVSIFGINVGLVISMALRIAILIGMLTLVFIIIRKNIGVDSGYKLMTVPAMILIVLLLILGNARESWAEWSTELNRPGAEVGVRIYIPKDFRLKDNDRIRLAIDLTSERTNKNPFTLRIGDKVGQFYLDRPPVANSYYQKATYPVFEKYHDITKVEMPCWRRIPLAPQLLNELADSQGYVDVRIGVEDNPEIGYRIYGDYSEKKNNTITIPGFKDYSIERFVEKDDPRIWNEYILSSDSIISYNVVDGQTEYNDLSDESGQQFGRYRIYLELLTADGIKYYL